MMRISTFKTALRKLSVASALAFLLPCLAKADLGITVVTTQNGNEVTADFLVYNFEEIVSMQFTVQWNPSNLVYEYTTNHELYGLSSANFGTNMANNGILTFSWFDPTTNGVSLTDCDRIFSLKLQTSGSQLPPIVINGSLIPVQIINSNGQSVNLTQTSFCSDAGQIIGNIFNDTNDNCLKDGGETGLDDWKVKIESDGAVVYGTANANGDYNFLALPGNYDVTLILPENNLWTACQPTQNVDLATNQPVIVNFAAQVLVDCPQLEVDLAAPFLRRCLESNYHVQYCNHGTSTAEDAYVEITLDPYLSAISSSIPWTTVDGQTYTFPIGDVAVGQCGSFSVTVEVSCDAVPGQTHCSEAHIFPDEICQPINPLWDGSFLDVTGNCDGDSVHFTITNIGDNMQDPVGFIVIEDDMVNFSGSPIQLDAGGSYVVSVPANGSTWRVEVENAATSPFEGSASVSVEGCGMNGNGSFSLGFVTQFPQGDPSPFVDTDCQPNVGSYDPNDKTGYPNGYCAAHFIEPGQDIEYRIRFQNTGTDTAFNVVVRDTLPPTLDPAMVLPGATSHAYDFELLGNGVVQFTFPDIMLPDSNANEMASHGFVNFKVSQVASNANGTVIGNQAAIHFDLNDPVYTNIYTHTVANNFVQSAGTDGDLSVSGYVHTWYGAPVEGVEVTLAPTCPVYTDANGHYEFLQLDTADYMQVPIKVNVDKQEGVTVLDLIKLGGVILGVNPFNTAYQNIAAEVNNSGSVSTFDVVEQRKMAIGLPVGNSAQYWKFVVADFVFPAPFPLVPYPTIINYNSLTESVDDADFIAIKPGNVITESMVDSSILKPHFYFKTNPLANGQVEVEVKAIDFYLMNGFQFGLTWDPAVMTFSGLVPASLDGTDKNPVVPGQLQLITFVSSGPGLTLPDSTTLFTIVFNALAPVGSSTPLTLNETQLPFQVVVEDCKLAGATMENTTVTIENPSGTSDVQGNGFTMKIAPNPVRSGQPVFIETTTETARALTLQVFDVNGRLLRNWERGVPAGTSDFTVQTSLEKGLYLLKITDGNGEGKAVRLVVF